MGLSAKAAVRLDNFHKWAMINKALESGAGHASWACGRSAVLPGVPWPKAFAAVATRTGTSTEEKYRSDSEISTNVFPKFGRYGSSSCLQEVEYMATLLGVRFQGNDEIAAVANVVT
eukprot:scaffold179255_cov27-Prasinocladus_malaysianus.AAC.1